MTDTRYCPHCHMDLQGDPIPQEYRDKGYYRSTHYRKEIGVNIRGVYDGVLYWQCPECGGKWHRWTEDTRPDLRARAEEYVNR